MAEEDSDSLKAATGYASRDSSRWLWIALFTAFALMSLSSGRSLLAAGMLLLGVFACFNNPLSPTTSKIAVPTPVMALSWACGLAGIVAVLVAAAKPWL